MAIIVLLLWALTASAGLRLLFTSGLGRHDAEPAQGQSSTTAGQAAPPLAEPAATPAAASTSASTSVAAVAAGSPGAGGSADVVAAGPAMSKRDARRAARERLDPPTLVRSRNQPMPGLRDLVEFAHPACAIIGLAFWLGYALVHNRTLAWIAFGLVTLTACAGLAWFTANTRAARRREDSQAGPSFSPRLIALHGGAAATTFVLAALIALTARG
jgi:hypothetical protein